MDPVTLRVLSALITVAVAKGAVSVYKTFSDGRRNIEEPDGTQTTVRKMTDENADSGLWGGERELHQRLLEAVKNNAASLALAAGVFTALSFNVYGSDEAVQQLASSASDRLQSRAFV